MARKKKLENEAADEKEDPTVRFERVIKPRLKALGNAFLKINRLPSQPTYKITAEQATIVINWINSYYEAFTNAYNPIATGAVQSIKEKSEIELPF